MFENLVPKRSVIVVDTNVLWSNDKELRSTVTWKTLLEIARYNVNRAVVIPEIVVRELARHERNRVRRLLRAGANEWSDALQKLRSAGFRFADDLPAPAEIRAHPVLTIEELADELRAELASSGVFVSEIPSVDHSELVWWSLREHPPFDQSDKGYRDALIWHSVQEVALTMLEGTVVVFVTADNDCRRSGSDELHALLAEELLKVGANTVTLSRTLGDAVRFTSTSVQPVLHEGGDEALALSAESLEEIIRRRVEQLCSELEGVSLESNTAVLGSLTPVFDYCIDDAIEGPVVSSVSPDWSTLFIQPHETYTGSTEIGSLTIQAGVEYEGLISKEDYADLSDLNFDEVYDWDDRFLSVNGSFRVELTCDYAANIDGIQAFDFELASVL
ncbi:PIN domain-containing protein [Gordonia sp. N1V]|uniref:PIN domain-containing protein n=1 Tax=Gordonia sp. N1V TaxID=3034163 RepID=UPI0023E282FD|nr:PIN domain-containing protein [Gordonia sp. N1V]MDF3284648.1 PIN domain-containing protein [Gordonia sp. N1V]